MKRRKLVVIKDEVKRRTFLKNEIKKIILKSVIQNFQINDIIRLKAFKKLIFFKKKSFISKQNNMCLIQGRFGGVYKNYDLCRHHMKYIAKYNLLHNMKIKS